MANLKKPKNGKTPTHITPTEEKHTTTNTPEEVKITHSTSPTVPISVPLPAEETKPNTDKIVIPKPINLL